MAFTFLTDVSEEACWILLGCSSVKIVPIIFQVGPHSAPRHRAGCGPEPLRSSPGPASPPSSPKGLPFAGLELEEGAEGTAPPPPPPWCSVKLVADSFLELLSVSGSWPGWGSRDSIGLFPFWAMPSFASANQKPLQGADCGSPARPWLCIWGIGCSWAKRSPLKHP